MLTSVETDLLKVLADPLRMRIARLLAREALCVCHLVEETGVKQTNLSNHLKVLREAGLVDTEPCGRFLYYRLKADVVAELAASLGRLADTAARTATSDRKRPCT